jgi:hypothetical protein
VESLGVGLGELVLFRCGVGGYNSTDPAPAPDQFLRLALGKHIHYFIITNPVQQDKRGHLDLTQ